MVNGFSMVLFTREPSLSMVFHMSTIGINGFPMVFTCQSLVSMVFQWFFNVEPLGSMVYSMVTVYLVFWLWKTEMEI